LPISVDQGTQFVSLQLVDTWFDQYDHVKASDYILMQAETLSDLPLDQVAADSPFDMFSGDRQTQARMAKFIGSCQHGHIASANLAGT